MKLQKRLHLFLLFILAVLCIGYIFPLYKSKGLSGWWPEYKKPSFSTQTYFSSEFQNDFEAWFNKKSTFYNDFVRLRNQIYYSLFNVVVSDVTIAGKDDYFYEADYIYNGLYGSKRNDKEHYTEKSRKLKRLQDYWQREGKTFLFVAAPGKGTLYPEYVPKYLKHIRKQTPPQQVYLKLFDSLGINYINFDKYFVENRDKFVAPVYSRYGIHYNKYGTYIVMDSLCKYFDKIYENMPQIVVDSMLWDNEVWVDEHDCFKSANLIAKADKERLLHPQIHFTKTNTKRPKCIFIGDSYLWPLIVLNFNNDYFENSQLWFYFNQAYLTDGSEKPVKNLDIRKELEEADVIMFLFTNATTLDKDNYCVNTLYELYFGKE